MAMSRFRRTTWISIASTKKIIQRRTSFWRPWYSSTMKLPRPWLKEYTRDMGKVFPIIKECRSSASAGSNPIAYTSKVLIDITYKALPKATMARAMTMTKVYMS